MCLCLCLCLSVCLPACLPACLSASNRCLSVCPSVCLSVCLCLSVSVCLSVSLSVSLCLCLCLSLSLCLCLSVSVSVSLSLCLSLCLCLPLSLSRDVNAMSACNVFCLGQAPLNYLGFLCSLILYRFLCTVSYRLDGLVVKWSRRADPGFDFRFLGGFFFSGSSHTSDLNMDTPVATLSGAWRYRVGAGTGWPGVSIL